MTLVSGCAALLATGLAADVLYPQKTIRFPGGGSTEFCATANAVVGGSWWNREGGVTAFDCTNPSNLVCASVVKNCGYVTSAPVAVPGTTFAVFTDWHSATVVDTSDPKDARVVQTLGFDLSERRAIDIRLVGRLLLVQGDRRCTVYKWNDATSRFDTVDEVAAKPADFPGPPPTDGRVKRWFAEDERKGVRIVGDFAYLFSRERSSVSSYALTKGRPVKLDEKFLIWGLPSVAIDGDRARIYAACASGGHVLVTLDLKKEGLVDFEREARVEKVGKGERKSYPVMGMRSSGVVVSAGGRIVSDGLAGGLSADGDRVASARGEEIVVQDWSRHPKSAVVSRFALTNLLHATGVALKGGVLYAIAEPKTAPRQSFLCTPPPERSVLLVLDVSAPEARELARLDVPTATTCELVREGLLYVPGIARGDTPASFAVVDVSEPSAPKVVATPKGLVEGSCYRIRTFPEGVFLADGAKVKRLDLADPRAPTVAAEYVSNREVRYGVDDFDVAGGRVYAISHASLAVYAVDGSGGVAPKAEADMPVWSEKPPDGFAIRTTCERKVSLPEGECVASVVAKDGTTYVAAGYSGLAVVAPDGRVSYARHRGPRAHYNYNYATGVALSADGRRVCLFSGEGEGCYLTYDAAALRAGCGK